MSETPFQNRIYLVFATVIRIPDSDFLMKEIVSSHILIHLLVYQKNDTYCNMYQNMYYIFCTRYNMYQKNDTRNDTRMDRVN